MKRQHQFLSTATAIATLAGAVVVSPLGAGSVAAGEDPGVDCAEWNGSDFDAWVDRLNPYMVRVNLTYDDSAEPFDVCPYTVSFRLRDGDGTIVWDGGANATFIASETESIVGAAKFLIPFEGCDWQVEIAIEESLPIVLDSIDICLDDLGFTFEPVEPVLPIDPVITLPPIETVELPAIVAPVEIPKTVEPAEAPTVVEIAEPAEIDPASTTPPVRRDLAAAWNLLTAFAR